jgi:hypothetical protein
MKKEELLALVTALQVINLNSNKSALGVILTDDANPITMGEHIKFSGPLNTAVMLDWLHKKATNQLTILRISNATYELENILPNVMVDFKAAAEKFCNLSDLAMINLAADYAKHQMGES